MLANLRELPERQRATLVLSELQGLSQAEIATVLGVRSEQVKAYAYQARSNLISEKVAREADCTDIRKELATARGAALRKRRLRRHLRTCGGCREYEDAIAGQRQGFAALLPVVPSLALKMRALQDMIDSAGVPGVYVGGTAVGGSVAGTAVIAGGSMKALVAKVAAGVVAIGAASGVGVAALDGSLTSEGGSSTIERPLVAAAHGRRSGRARRLPRRGERRDGARPPPRDGRACGQQRKERRHARVGAGAARRDPRSRRVRAATAARAKAAKATAKAANPRANPARAAAAARAMPARPKKNASSESEERAKKAQEHQHKSEERKRKAEERQRKAKKKATAAARARR